MITIGVFAVYDNKAQAFMEPFFARNAATAIRAFQDNISRPDSIFAKYPNDFVLYQIGEFNDQDGSLEDRSENTNLGMAIQFCNTELEAVQ